EQGLCERTTMALRTEDYALIGDCKTAALVGRTSFIRRSWLGSHSIARRTSWKLKHSTSQGSDGARSPTKSMPRSVSAVSTATLTALCRLTAPNGLTPVCC